MFTFSCLTVAAEVAVVVVAGLNVAVDRHTHTLACVCGVRLSSVE